MSFSDYKSKKKSIAILGLGYVGLPLAELLSREFHLLGFDISSNRIDKLKQGIDKTGEISSSQLRKSNIQFTNDIKDLKDCSLLIATVPTPVNEFQFPDLEPLINVSALIGSILQKGMTIVYESTVYPGVTEDVCRPVLEKESGLKWPSDFNIGYSPERVNPGDKNHTIEKITKVVAGDTKATGDLLTQIYGEVVTAGVHLTKNIKTAEAAKVIENTQRDLNIALMNELSIIFNKMEINTLEVLEAAATKWNFLKFYPGLVGGHCIGVDPYYLTHAAKKVGYHPQVVLSGRQINDQMGNYVAEEVLKSVIKENKSPTVNPILLCGLTFKENVPDFRNTKVIDIIEKLSSYGVQTEVYDPMVDEKTLLQSHNLNLINKLGNNYSAVIIAVPHKVFREELSLTKVAELQKGRPIIFDLKEMFSPNEAREKGYVYFSL